MIFLLLLALTASPDDNVLASLQRTGCYGTCPAYEIQIFRSGRIDWLGKHYVKTVGSKTAHLTPAQLKAVQEAFATAHFMTLTGNFDCQEMTDHPSATLSFNDNGVAKTIVHYHGCRSTPGVDVLSKLENQIDAIVRSAQWIGTPDEVQKAARKALEQ
jgi:hypothetical protein